MERAPPDGRCGKTPKTLTGATPNFTEFSGTKCACKILLFTIQKKKFKSATGAQSRPVHFTADIYFKSRKLSPNISTTSSSETVIKISASYFGWQDAHSILVIFKKPSQSLFLLN